MIEAAGEANLPHADAAQPRQRACANARRLHVTQSGCLDRHGMVVCAAPSIPRAIVRELPGKYKYSRKPRFVTPAKAQARPRASSIALWGRTRIQNGPGLSRFRGYVAETLAPRQ